MFCSAGDDPVEREMMQERDGTVAGAVFLRG